MAELEQRIVNSVQETYPLSGNGDEVCQRMTGLSKVQAAFQQSDSWRTLLLSLVVFFWSVAIVVAAVIALWIFAGLISVTSWSLNLPVGVVFIFFVLSLINVKVYRSPARKSIAVTRLGLESLNIPLYRASEQSHLAINLVGGLLPVMAALYQLVHVSPLAILTTASGMTLLYYFSVEVIPSKCVCIRTYRLFLLSLVSGSIAMMTAKTDAVQSVMAIAFAGNVLGAFIGADLLHIGDVRLEIASGPLSIGGAGTRDGIFICGLLALLMASGLPPAFSFLNKLLPVVYGDILLLTLVVSIALWLVRHRLHSL